MDNNQQNIARSRIEGILRQTLEPVVGNLTNALLDNGVCTREALEAEQAYQSIGAHTARVLAERKTVTTLPPIPTHEELAAQGKLYSQRCGRGIDDGSKAVVPIVPITGPRKDRIIQHLKDVWMPWIEAGILTRPQLLHADISAYNALGLWAAKSGNDLVKELGYDIPSKSDLIDRKAASFEQRRDVPAHIDWALRAREAKSKKAAATKERQD